MTNVQIAVVTGGHHFDVIGLHRLFRTLDGIDGYIQHMEDFAGASDSARQRYDGIVFYTHFQGSPADDNQPEHLKDALVALNEVGKTQRGIVVLHHGLLTYPGWPTWGEMIGMSDQTLAHYSHDEEMTVTVADAQHPITAGLKSWTMTDETYAMPEPNPDNHILLTTDHPKSMKALAWTRQYRQSRVFCLQPGHDSQSWSNSYYRQLLQRGILWSCEAI